MLHPISETEFDAFYALLETSFPDDEYRPYAAQQALLRDPKYTVYAAGDLSAVITVWQFPDFAFIEHFAVSPTRRNQGLGAVVLREALQMLNCPVCLEAELPDTDIAKRRVGFYQRNGFYVNAYPYVQPPYSADKQPVPLKILTTDGPITSAQFTHIRDTLYREVYGQI